MNITREEIYKYLKVDFAKLKNDIDKYKKKNIKYCIVSGIKYSDVDKFRIDYQNSDFRISQDHYYKIIDKLEQNKKDDFDDNIKKLYEIKKILEYIGDYNFIIDVYNYYIKDNKVVKNV